MNDFLEKSAMISKKNKTKINILQRRHYSINILRNLQIMKDKNKLVTALKLCDFDSRETVS